MTKYINLHVLSLRIFNFIKESLLFNCRFKKESRKHTSKGRYIVLNEGYIFLNTFPFGQDSIQDHKPDIWNNLIRLYKVRNRTSQYWSTFEQNYIWNVNYMSNNVKWMDGFAVLKCYQSFLEYHYYFLRKYKHSLTWRSY